MNRYTAGFVDACALVVVTIMIILAALLSAGCAARRVEPSAPPPSSSTGCVYTLVDVRVVELVDEDREVQP